DFDQDGRIDLALSQNNGPTKLFLNQRGKKGLRVSVDAGPGNPEGIGAQLRIVYADGALGPCRCIQSGSGYWSQDAAVQVLGLRDGAVALWIRWPGGK